MQQLAIMEARKMNTNERRRRNSEQGAIMLITVLSIGMLIALVSIVVNVSYSRVVSTELQVAADAAVHAGSATMCSDDRCWDGVINTTLEAIKEQADHGPLRNTGYSTPTSTGPATWDAGKLKLTIHRGRWWNDTPPGNVTLLPGTNFEPIDTPDWAAAHPNIPPFLAINALYVKVERPDINLFVNIFGGGQYTKSAESVAAGNKIGRVCVAPFAVTTCSLVNPRGEYRPENSCRFDRLFTEAKRYCPADQPNCRIMPSFPYYPASSYSAASFDPEQAITDICAQRCGEGSGNEIPEWCSFCHSVLDQHINPIIPLDPSFNFMIGGYVPASIKDSFWEYPKTNQTSTDYVDFGDLYGVVGIPRPISVATEGNIQNVLFTQVNPNCPVGTVPGNIGDQFDILPDGLTDPLSQQRIMQRIDDSSLTFGQTDLLSAIVQNYQPSFDFDEVVFPGPVANQSTNPPTNLNLVRYGLCNSELFAAGTRGNNDTTPAIAASQCDEAGEDITPTYLKNNPTNARDGAKVWKIAVPVIAEDNGPACATVTPVATDDPPVATGAGHTYTIVGFVSVDFFDADIGMDSPKPLTQCPDIDTDGDGTTDASLAKDLPWGFNYTRDGRHPNMTTPLSKDLNHRDRCNLVRARLTCENNLLASRIDLAEKPYIVQ